MRTLRLRGFAVNYLVLLVSEKGLAQVVDKRVATEGHPYIYADRAICLVGANVGAALRGRPILDICAKLGEIKLVPAQGLFNRRVIDSLNFSDPTTLNRALDKFIAEQCKHSAS